MATWIRLSCSNECVGQRRNGLKEDEYTLAQVRPYALTRRLSRALSRGLNPDC